LHAFDIDYAMPNACPPLPLKMLLFADIIAFIFMLRDARTFLFDAARVVAFELISLLHGDRAARYMPPF